jgi:hypothetical protein
LFEQKNKREPEGAVEPGSEETSFVLEPTPVEIGCGYTLQVSMDANEKPVVDVKTYGEVDIRKIRREIERTFPNARIRQLGTTPTVTVARRSQGKSKARKK